MLNGTDESAPDEDDRPSQQNSSHEIDQSYIANRSGGVDVNANEVRIGADAVGRDKIVQTIYNIYGAPPGGEAGQASQTLSDNSPRSAKIFISYKHNVSLDESLALQLHQILITRRHQSFIDQTMPIGVDWAKEIRRQVESADYCIVFLSSESIQSEMLAAEVEFAYRHFNLYGKPIILPVRLAFSDRLPYRLSTYLDHIQYALWRSEADTESVVAALLNAIESSETLLAQGTRSAKTPLGDKIELSNDGSTFSLTRPVDSPLPDFDPRLILEAPGGAVKIRSQFYIERVSDGDLRRQVMGDGTTTTIRAPRQMGKTSLLARGVHAARSTGQHVVYLDFQRINQTYLSSLDSLLRYIADEIVLRLNVDSVLTDKAWSSSRGPQDKLNNLLEQHILPVVKTPILLAMDEVDRLLDAPFKADFFGLLRSWDSTRAYDELWQLLNVALVISTHPHLLIPDISQSPFNIGLRIQLSDFTAAQVGDLNQRHGLPLESDDLPRLMDLLGGHPYLTRQALYTVVDQRLTWPELARFAPIDDGPFGSHLHMYLWQIAEHPNLVDGMREVLRHERCSDEVVRYRLSAAGLVKEVGDRCIPRCGLYTQYFKGKL
jgi:hypothetical protein